ncbi:MAG: glycosyltransferase family 1 protein [Patescibacteria group bacterium]|jgi:glycosyltransferase involved in cell wall biosynthesis
MKIGIDCRMWNQTGIGRHIRCIVDELSRMDSANEYVLFFLKEDINSVELPDNFRKVCANIRWHTFSEQLILPFIYLRERLDILHVPHFNVPVLYPKRFVATIHDLTILRVKTGRATTLPYPIYFLKRLAFKLNLISTVKRACKIFTVSDFVRKDIQNTFGISSDKIILTPNAVDPNFVIRSDEEVLSRYGIKRPYIFYVGNAHPHKNLETLISAFEIISHRIEDLELVLAGGKRFFYERLEKECSNKKVKFIGFVEDVDLPALYHFSEAFVNPSMYEGFGIQILEAFACGTKVICSNTTSLPEVGADVAYYFDPRDKEDMAMRIIQALDDKDTSRRERGFGIVKTYSWESSARKILGTYENCHSL